MPRGRGCVRPQRLSRSNTARQPEPASSATRSQQPSNRGRKRTAEVPLEDFVDERVSQTNADIWVIGDSIPYWAGNHAIQTGKKNLRLPGQTIAWLGVRGLRWSTLRREIEAKVLLSPAPSLILIHLGGNDLVHSHAYDIKGTIQDEVSYLHDAFPSACIIWIDILPRRVWGKFDNKSMNLKRKRVNRLGRHIVSSLSKFDIVKPDIDIETAFYREDGVHLNLVGLEFYLDYLRDAMLKNL
ncbi:uncharacterized protein LOC132745207 isoform X2 [Ruditapes philippinarum]|uniref:uncharacterized protein LOC132745207 isoform X2 n=1 Tax=Ruditapes philippinarum TaxID=129788 RepID=UPI00295C015B|nr:uncharacterized protein LOC132745207 isoform X2 [Ruditapes philippinarum]